MTQSFVKASPVSWDDKPTHEDKEEDQLSEGSDEEAQDSTDTSDLIGNTDDSMWQDQLGKYTSSGMLANDVVREHKIYVRKVQMMKEMARKCVRALEYFLA